MGTVNISTTEYTNLIEQSRVLKCVKQGTMQVGINVPVMLPLYFGTKTTYTLLDTKDIPKFVGVGINDALGLAEKFKQKHEKVLKLNKELKEKISSTYSNLSAYLVGISTGIVGTLIAAVLI